MSSQNRVFLIFVKTNVMGLIFYNITVGIYNLLLWLVSPISDKALKIVRGRKYWIRYLSTNKVSQSGEKSVWIHCASLGEFEQGRPVIEAIKLNHPDVKIYISFFSSSGYDVRKTFPLAELVFYLPSDSEKNAEILFNSLEPNLVIFVKYEFWFYYIRMANKRKSPVVSISTILRPDQLFFRSYGGFYRKILKMFDRYFVQNQNTLDLLNGLGIRKAEISGDTRFDRVRQICSNPKNIHDADKFSHGKDVVILGSTWPGDIDVIRHYINKNPLNLKYIIAPHNVLEQEIRNLEKDLSLQSIRFSDSDGQDLSKYDVLIIDNIGMLSSLYQYGKLAYIGGAFRGGLHNILEAATFGLPVIFGKHKNNSKFQEAIDLIRIKGAFAIQSAGEFEEIIHKLFTDPEIYSKASRACSTYVIENSGATTKIMKYISTILSD